MEILEGDSLEVLRGLSASTFDALVTDPPAGIGFMGAEWDGDKGGREQWVAWLAGVMREALRVLRPGAHGLVWALPRTSHWTATALEDAGFEVRDVVTHLFGTGFPKHKAALKPGGEHWVLVRKPLDGSANDNVEKHGTGMLEVDSCRISVDDKDPNHRTNGRPTGGNGYGGNWGQSRHQLEGRWPANVTLDEEAAAMLDKQSGERGGGFGTRGGGSLDGRTSYALRGQGQTVGYGDAGGASRFFYVAKPSRRERGEGNTHPTVKSIALMRWLCRLVTPPGGAVLDPFAGSGTTGLACAAEGLRFLGIEKNPVYAALARKRLQISPVTQSALAL